MFWFSPERDVVRVHGPDAITYLHSQLSQDVQALGVGQRAWSFVLQPTGKVDVLLRVSRLADETLVLDTDGGYGETMLARLNRFKIRVKADIEPLDWHCIAVRGDAGGADDLLGPDITPPDGVPEGTAEDFADARIAAGWPAMGAEILPGVTIPAETGIAELAVSFTKGCYPGQELVERMDSRGSAAPFHLVVLDRRDGDAVGGDVVVDGATVGTITSVGRREVLARLRRGIDRR